MLHGKYFGNTVGRKDVSKMWEQLMHNLNKREREINKQIKKFIKSQKIINIMQDNY